MTTTVRLNIAQEHLHRSLTGPGGMVTRYVMRTVRDIENRAKMLTPVDTGNLRASITRAVRTEGLLVVGTVGTPVEYALVVHEGRKAGTETVAAHTVKARKIKAHTVAARTQLAYTVPAKGGRKAYTVRAHTIRKHRVAARTQLTHTVPEHTRRVTARAGRPFLRRAMEEVVTGLG